MDQAEQLCDSVCIIARGRKVLDGDLVEIRRSNAGRHYRIEFDEVTPAVLDVMGSGGFAGARRVGDTWTLDLPAERDVQQALVALAARSLALSKFEHVKPSLHEVFVDRVGHAEIADRRPEETRA
jgi:ABC-2 type transport system ATP-binding protein